MNVTVFFIGICVHIDDDPPNPRVVLPDCSNGLNAAGHVIPAHIAKLSIPAEFVAKFPETITGLTQVDGTNNLLSWQMNGLRLGLQSGSGELTKSATYCLPSLTLTAYEETPGVQLSLNDAVTNDGAAACVFGITVGTLDTFLPLNSEAVHGKLTVGTDQAELTVKQISDQTKTTITLQASTTSDPIIFLSNTGGGDDSDGDADFLLSYLVTTFMPSTVLKPKSDCIPRPATPDENSNLQLGGNIGEGLTIGCSNSVYP